jgi:putative transcriptional regulator
VLTDPNFASTVVLMLSHDATGALGLVLNRIDTEIPSSPVASWVVHGPGPRSLFAGGPVQPEGLIGVISLPTSALDERVGSDSVGEWFTPFVSMGSRTVGTVDLSVGVDVVSHIGHDVWIRVYRGYSGWGPGQLDHELTRPGWLVVDAAERDPFVDEPWELWRAVLRRQRGDLAWLARFPEDLTAN